MSEGGCGLKEPLQHLVIVDEEGFGGKILEYGSCSWMLPGISG